MSASPRKSLRLGGELFALAPPTDMSENTHHPTPGAAVDKLVDQLLDCGGALSQIIGGMIQLRPRVAPLPTQHQFRSWPTS